MKILNKNRNEIEFWLVAGLAPRYFYNTVATDPKWSKHTAMQSKQLSAEMCVFFKAYHWCLWAWLKLMESCCCVTSSNSASNRLKLPENPGKIIQANPCHSKSISYICIYIIYIYIYILYIIYIYILYNIYIYIY